MAAQSNRSVTLYLVLGLLVAEFAVTAWRSEADTQAILQAERREIEHTLGPKAGALLTTVDDWFVIWCRDSGAMAATAAFAAPAPAASDAFEVALNNSVLSTADSTMRSMWTSVYLAVNRLAVAVAFLPLLALFAAASTYDGWQQRKVKLMGFAQSSPQSYGVARAVNSFALAVPVLYFFAPMTIPLYVVPAWALVLGLGIQTQTAQLPRV